MTYCPQSSGKVKCINRTLKLQLKKKKKLCQKTHLQWDQLAPTALLKIRSSPTKWTGLSPFKILFELPPLVKGLRGDLKETGDDLSLRQQIKALGLTLLKISNWINR
jgi:hypothetical protein